MKSGPPSFLRLTRLFGQLVRVIYTSLRVNHFSDYSLKVPDDDVADYLRKEELIRAHATLLFNELRPRSPFFLTVYTYTRILERVSNYTMLFALLFILTFFDASSVFIILIRQRLNNLPGY